MTRFEDYEYSLKVCLDTIKESESKIEDISDYETQYIFKRLILANQDLNGILSGLVKDLNKQGILQ